MDAIERSNLVLAKILNLAMLNGLSHWSLRFKDLELGQDYTTYFYPCVEWLEREGLIRVGQYARTMGGVANGEIVNISLTARGMNVLGHNVEFDGTNEPLSETVINVSEGRVDYHRISDTIGGLIGGVIKSVSG